MFGEVNIDEKELSIVESDVKKVAEIEEPAIDDVKEYSSPEPEPEAKSESSPFEDVIDDIVEEKSE